MTHYLVAQTGQGPAGGVDLIAVGLQPGSDQELTYVGIEVSGGIGGGVPLTMHVLPTDSFTSQETNDKPKKVEENKNKTDEEKKKEEEKKEKERRQEAAW